MAIGIYKVDPQDQRIAQLRADLKRCLALVDELGLHSVAPHLDLTIARLDGIIEGAPSLADGIDPALLESFRAENEDR